MPLMVRVPAAGGPEPVAARFRLAFPGTATVLAVLVLMLLAGALVLSAWTWLTWAYKQVIDAAESFGATAKEAPGTVRFVVQHGCPKYAKKLAR